MATTSGATRPPASGAARADGAFAEIGADSAARIRALRMLAGVETKGNSAAARSGTNGATLGSVLGRAGESGGREAIRGRAVARPRMRSRARSNLRLGIAQASPF